MADEFKASCDIAGNLQRSQSFTATTSGVLKYFGITTLKSGYPNKDLNLSFYEADGDKIKGTGALAKITIPQESIGWSAKDVTVTPDINLIKGKKYIVVLHSDTSQGCYGFASGSSTTTTDEISSVSQDKGSNFSIEKNQKLKFHFLIE